MTLFIKLLLIFWFLECLKQALFWIYLWQLKEYHIPRFIDHFETAKGKQLLYNKLRIFKIVLLVLMILSLSQFFSRQGNFGTNGFLIFWLYILFFVYLAQAGLFLKQVFTGNFRRPKITAKTLILLAISVLIIFGFLYLAINSDYPVYLLALDAFMPIIVSAVVLLVQPFFVFLRNRILKKAKKKIEFLKSAKGGGLMVVGITGSYGKTTTKEFLTTILSPYFKVLSTKEHKNSEMGIAQTILKDLKPEHQIFIVEMGAYKRGGIKLLADMTGPRIGIVTGVNEQHLSLFGSLENLLSAEGGKELLEALPKNGLIVVNGENKYCVDLYKKAGQINKVSKKIFTETGERIDSDIFAQNIEVSNKHVSFVVMAEDKEACHFKVNVLGRQNLQNLLGAILIAKELGLSLEEISKSSEKIRQEQTGIVLKKGKHSIDIIDSSYSSNPDGVIADLDCLDLFIGKKAIIMPCLIELGPESKKIHQKIGRKIAKVCDLAIITTRERFEDIEIGAIENGMKPQNIIFMENPETIYHKITTSFKKGDAVLLEGRVPVKLIKLLIDEK
jgi:UDP-N-acetylmuramoyl-tripeptide--D-alanyl-D-alanine ligase